MKQLDSLEKYVVVPNVGFYGGFKYDGEDIMLCEDHDTDEGYDFKVTQKIVGDVLITELSHYSGCLRSDDSMNTANLVAHLPTNLKKVVRCKIYITHYYSFKLQKLLYSYANKNIATTKGYLIAVC